VSYFTLPFGFEKFVFGCFRFGALFVFGLFALLRLNFVLLNYFQMTD